MRLTVRCGEFDGEKQCATELREIDVPGFPDPEWYRGGNYERLSWEDSHYDCPKHGAVEIHDSDLLERALKTGRDTVRAKRRVVMAKRPAHADDP